ncbi:lambda exonuclease family protein [Sphingomonas soli]|uniref:lambda exonuclease family protein n=1 Tax=Sphingomonas soli TaxID=266127 RepID=UPI0009FE1599|nr:lambda exonuclease family protein [Sphingomonas soli]
MSAVVEQRTPEWFGMRLGKATASKIADIVARTKTGYSASRANYAAQLICERLTGTPTEGFSNAAMQWGTDHEADARDAYAFLADVDVAEVGFVPHPKISMAGASPDGLVGDDGLVEIKCPNTATHIEVLRTGAVADKYIVQMLWQMACTGRKWCDFVSFDPRLPAELQLLVRRIYRDDERIRSLEAEVVSFLGEIDDAITELNLKYRPVANDGGAANLLRAG